MQSVLPPDYKECYECFWRHVGWGETEKTKPVEIIGVSNFKNIVMPFDTTLVKVILPKCIPKIYF